MQKAQAYIMEDYKVFLRHFDYLYLVSNEDNWNMLNYYD